MRAAQQVQDLSLSLYKVGTTSYLDVVVAQSAALSAEVTRVATEPGRYRPQSISSARWAAAGPRRNSRRNTINCRSTH